MTADASLRNLMFLSLGMFIGFANNNLLTEFILSTSTNENKNNDAAAAAAADLNASRFAEQLEQYQATTGAEMMADQAALLKSRCYEQLEQQAQFYDTKILDLQQQQQQPPQQPQTQRQQLEPIRIRATVRGANSATTTTTNNSNTAAVQVQFSKSPTGPALDYPLRYYEHTLYARQYFLPAHGLDRPAVQEFLNDRYFEPKTHCILEQLLHRHPGNMIHAGTFFGDMIPHFAQVLQDISKIATAAANTTTAAANDTEEDKENEQEQAPHAQYQLYAFEPNTRSYLLAQMAVEANALSNVILVNAALGPTVMQQRIQVQEESTTTAANDGNSDKNNNDDDQLVFNGFAMVKKKKTKQQQQQQQPRLLGGDSSVAPTTGTQRVPQLTIDMFQISHLSILALDTQDYETLVLQGAMQTLTNIATRPYVVALEDANVQRPATKFMQDFLPDYQFVQRMDCLTYFALVDVEDDVKQVLAECDSEIA